MIQLDAKGKACPFPVVEAKKALDTEEGKGGLVISVDNIIATENLTRFGDKMNYHVRVEEITSQHYNVYFSNTDTLQALEIPPSKPNSQSISGDSAALICSDTFGSGNDELGAALMKSFLYALTEIDTPPNIIIFCNAGVKIPIKGSDSLESLKKLAGNGTEILSCGACLNFYHLTDQLAIGSITNMYAISDILSKAARIIKP